MFLIVGLGNPGKTYINNRHNVGYKVVDALADFYNKKLFAKNFKSDFLKLDIITNI